eukprot:scaffold321312_cov35-Tisochrysis_lutea.AAC.2
MTRSPFTPVAASSMPSPLTTLVTPGATICVTGTLSSRPSNVGMDNTLPQRASISVILAV